MTILGRTGQKSRLNCPKKASRGPVARTLLHTENGVPPTYYPPREQYRTGLPHHNHRTAQTVTTPTERLSRTAAINVHPNCRSLKHHTTIHPCGGTIDKTPIRDSYRTTNHPDSSYRRAAHPMTPLSLPAAKATHATASKHPKNNQLVPMPPSYYGKPKHVHPPEGTQTTYDTPATNSRMHI
jgi:hypothetical protein